MHSCCILLWFDPKSLSVLCCELLAFNVFRWQGIKGIKIKWCCIIQVWSERECFRLSGCSGVSVARTTTLNSLVWLSCGCCSDASVVVGEAPLVVWVVVSDNCWWCSSTEVRSIKIARLTAIDDVKKIVWWAWNSSLQANTCQPRQKLTSTWDYRANQRTTTAQSTSISNPTNQNRQWWRESSPLLLPVITRCSFA